MPRPLGCLLWIVCVCVWNHASSVLLVLCEVNTPVTGGFSSQRVSILSMPFRHHESMVVHGINHCIPVCNKVFNISVIWDGVLLHKINFLWNHRSLAQTDMVSKVGSIKVTGRQPVTYSISVATQKYAGIFNRIHRCIYQASQIAKFMGPTWGPPGSCRPQMGPLLAPWTLLSGYFT